MSPIANSICPNPSNSGAFVATPSTAIVFSQYFSAFNFNPPTSILTCNPPSNITPETQPFTDVIPQPDGSCNTVIMSGNSQQAEVGDLRNFQAVFTGNFEVSAAGRATFNIWSSDGWINSIGPSSGGAQPGFASGPMLIIQRPVRSRAIPWWSRIMWRANLRTMTWL
ncbi:MAG: hypothetical protein JOZ87_25705 [Chloroflexi bacterium]|nr:hypothetical protein [Chloroflexota bacterium]